MADSNNKDSQGIKHSISKLLIIGYPKKKKKDDEDKKKKKPEPRSQVMGVRG